VEPTVKDKETQFEAVQSRTVSVQTTLTGQQIDQLLQMSTEISDSETDTGSPVSLKKFALIISDSDSLFQLIMRTKFQIL